MSSKNRSSSRSQCKSSEEISIYDEIDSNVKGGSVSSDFSNSVKSGSRGFGRLNILKRIKKQKSKPSHMVGRVSSDQTSNTESNSVGASGSLDETEFLPSSRIGGGAPSRHTKSKRAMPRAPSSTLSDEVRSMVMEEMEENKKVTKSREAVKEEDIFLKKYGTENSQISEEKELQSNLGLDKGHHSSLQVPTFEVCDSIEPSLGKDKLKIGDGKTDGNVECTPKPEMKESTQSNCENSSMSQHKSSKIIDEEDLQVKTNNEQVMLQLSSPQHDQSKTSALQSNEFIAKSESLMEQELSRNSHRVEVTDCAVEIEEEKKVCDQTSMNEKEPFSRDNPREHNNSSVKQDKWNDLQYAGDNYVEKLTQLEESGKQHQDESAILSNKNDSVPINEANSDSLANKEPSNTFKNKKEISEERTALQSGDNANSSPETRESLVKNSIFEEPGRFMDDDDKKRHQNAMLFLQSLNLKPKDASVGLGLDKNERTEFGGKLKKISEKAEMDMRKDRKTSDDKMMKEQTSFHEPNIPDGKVDNVVERDEDVEQHPFMPASFMKASTSSSKKSDCTPTPFKAAEALSLLQNELENDEHESLDSFNLRENSENKLFRKQHYGGINGKNPKIDSYNEDNLRLRKNDDYSFGRFDVPKSIEHIDQRTVSSMDTGTIDDSLKLSKLRSLKVQRRNKDIIDGQLEKKEESKDNNVKTKSETRSKESNVASDKNSIEKRLTDINSKELSTVSGFDINSHSISSKKSKQSMDKAKAKTRAQNVLPSKINSMKLHEKSQIRPQKSPENVSHRAKPPLASRSNNLLEKNSENFRSDRLVINEAEQKTRQKIFKNPKKEDSGLIRTKTSKVNPKRPDLKSSNSWGSRVSSLSAGSESYRIWHSESNRIFQEFGFDIDLKSIDNLLDNEDLLNAPDLHEDLNRGDWGLLHKNLILLFAQPSFLQKSMSSIHPVNLSSPLHEAVWKAPPALTVMIGRLAQTFDEDGGIFLLQDRDKNTALHLCAANLQTVQANSKGVYSDDGSTSTRTRSETKIDTTVLSFLLKAEPRAIRMQNLEGDTPLHLLLSSFDMSNLSMTNVFELEKAVRMFAEADPSACLLQEKTGVTPLHVAIANKCNEGIVNALVTCCPSSCSKSDYHGMLPLHYLAAFGHSTLKTVQSIIKAYPEGINKTSKNGDTALHVAVSNSTASRVDVKVKSKKEVCKIFECLARPVESSQRSSIRYPLATYNNEKLTPLHCCLLFDAPFYVLKHLMGMPLAQKAALMTDSVGATPLHLAVAQSRVCVSLSAVKTLGLVPEAAATLDKNKRTALHVAAQNKDSTPELFETLLRYNDRAASLRTSRGHLPLHLACQSKVQVEAIKVLTRAYPKASEMRNKSGNTPLHDALKYGSSIDVIQHLVKINKEALYVQNHFGNTPLHCATFYHAPIDVINLLLKLWPTGATIQNSNKDTPLHAAADSNNMEVIEAIINISPASVLMPNNNGQTPIDRAKENKAPEEVVQLLERSCDNLGKQAEDDGWGFSK